MKTPYGDVVRQIEQRLKRGMAVDARKLYTTTADDLRRDPDTTDLFPGFNKAVGALFKKYGLED